VDQGFNRKQLDLLVSACNKNDQVYAGAWAYEPLKELLEKKYKIKMFNKSTISGYLSFWFTIPIRVRLFS